MNDLQKVFFQELCSMYDAENQLIRALPKMAVAAHSEALRDAFNQHLDQTREQAKRLEEVFRSIDEEPNRRTCNSMEGLIDDGQLIATEFSDNGGLDAALICAAQKIEHFEIVSYGCLCAWAEELGYEKALGFLEENLAEEKETDELLTQLAEEDRNPEARKSDTDKSGDFAKTVEELMTRGI